MKLTRASLTEFFSEKFSLPRRVARLLVNNIIAHLIQVIGQHHTCKISGFGTFFIHNKNPRHGRNPKTGQPALISPRSSLTFRASRKLKERVNTAAVWACLHRQESQNSPYHSVSLLESMGS